MELKKAIKTAINNVYEEGLTDIFPRPFEVDLLDNVPFKNSIYEEIKSAVSKAIEKETIENGNGLTTLKVHPLCHVLYPKKEAFDFRKCALIEPMDTLKYLVLTLLLGDVIEKSRINKTDNRIFSYRFSVQEEGKKLFDPKYNFKTFNEHANNRIKEDSVNILVKTDISNFYDRLNLHRLESVLLSLPINKNVVKLINELLLFWANRDSYGLPVGSNPSRILAEAALIDIDKYLLSHKVDFCRFVDDYRFFAPDSKTAHYWLSLLVERLSIEGLYINQGKTSLEDVSELGKEPSSKAVQEEEEEFINFGYNYSGTVPTEFIIPSEIEIGKIKEKSEKEIIESIENEKIISPKNFKEYCNLLVVKELFPKFKDLPLHLKRFPQFNPYVVDLLIKNSDKIPKKIKESIRKDFSKLLEETHYLPEYISIAAVNLLSSEGYENQEVLFSYFRELRRNAGAYIGRSTLEALEKIISRGQVLEIRQYYGRADFWEKRQIVKIVDRKLHLEEKNAWFKNIKMNDSSDLFLIGAIRKK